MRAYADEHSADIYSLMGQGDTKPTPFELCASCGAQLDRFAVSRFYCDEHRRDLEAGLDQLLGT